MKNEKLAASRKLSKLNLNVAQENIMTTTYWCRVSASIVDEWNYREHSHSFFELQFCLEGEGRFTVGGDEYKIGRGELLLLPPKARHRILGATDDFAKFIWGFSIDDDIAGELAKSASQRVLSKADKGLFDAVEVILQNADCEEFGSYGIIKNQLDYILKVIIRQLTNAKETGEFSKKTSMQAEEIRKFMLDNISAKLNTSDIAAQFFLTERQLEGLCRREYKMTVAELKKSMRLELIRKLLAETELTLSEIAMKSGFADEFVMSKFFKKHEFISPGKYRSACKE